MSTHNRRSTFSTRRLSRPAGVGERSTGLQYRLLRLLEANPVRTQSELATALGASPSTVNAQIRTLKDQGYLATGDSSHHDRPVNKCAYRLTPAGVQRRLAMTRPYLELRTQELETLHAEVTRLHAEMALLDGEMTRLRAEMALLDGEMTLLDGEMTRQHAEVTLGGERGTALDTGAGEQGNTGSAAGHDWQKQ